MSESVRNNTANVSTGGGVKTGYWYSAPVGTPLPTSPWDQLDPAFVNEGFISSDGIVNGIEASSDAIRDLNGEAMASTNGERTETVALTMAEVKAAVMREIYGYDNVTDEDGVLTVHSNSNPRPQRSYVGRIELRDGRPALFVIEAGQVTAIGELTINSSTLFARQITITCFAGETTGDTSKWIFESTETERPAHAEALSRGTYLGRDVRSLGTFEVYTDSVQGVAEKVTFKEFSSDPEEQEGYYVPLKIEPHKGTKITSSRKPEVTKEMGEDDWLIVFLGKEAPDQAKTLTVEEAGGRKFTYDLSGIVAADGE